MATVDGLASDVGDDVSSALARFLTVRACGHIELTFDECLAHYADEKAHPFIASHVRAGLFKGRNPRPDDLTERLRRINPSWSTSFVEYLDEDDNRRRRELGLLVDRRNSISHGQNEGLGVRKALDLARLALDVSAWFCSTLSPNAA
ncbi:hypothetical protein ITJ69_08345 [Curtobacterium sp. VKM Ac-2887]|nr:hypothetical protein [Curtobacterium sp. VKM Ac-2887]